VGLAAWVELVELAVVVAVVVVLAAAVAAQPKAGMAVLAEPLQDQLAGLLALRALEVRLAADQGRRLLAAMAIMAALAARDRLVRRAHRGHLAPQDRLAQPFRLAFQAQRPSQRHTGTATRPTSSFPTQSRPTRRPRGTFFWRPLPSLMVSCRSASITKES
jgi:hypothetical protein